MPTTTSSYPTDLDTFAPITAGPSGTRMNDATEPASAIITHLQAAVAAIQGVLGTDDGAVADSVLRRLLLLSDADVPASVATITATTKTLALTVLFLLLMLACAVDAGPTATPVAGANGGGRVVATATLRPTQELYLHPGERFTVVCIDHHPLVYGDNGNDSTGQPATGIAGYCEE